MFFSIPMKKANELFDLIKSLTTNEKRYFNLYANLQEGAKNYLELFDALEQQTIYNESKILEQYQDAPFTKHLSYTKNYLYRQILRALVHSQTDNFVEQSLWETLYQAKFLQRKQLYKQCERIVENLREKAYQHEAFDLLSDLLLLKGQLIIKFAIGNFEKDLLPLISERTQVMQLYQNYMEYKNLYDLLFYHIVLSGNTRKSGAQTEMKSVIDHHLLQDAGMALSKKAKIIFHNIRFIYAYYMADYETSLLHKQEALLLIESIPTYFTEDVDIYINNLSNIMVLLNHLHRYEETLFYIEKLKMLKLSSPALQSSVFQTYFNALLVVYAALAETDKPLALVTEIEAGLERFKNNINKIRRIDLCFNVAILYFKTEQYNLAHHWLEKVFNERGQIREDIQCFTRIFNLLIHYEMGNFLLIESLLRNYTRFLQKHKKVFRFEKIMLRFFQKIISITGRYATLSVFKDLQTNLQTLKQDPKEQLPLTFFDFISWVECKIEGQPLLIVMKRKANKTESPS